MIIFGLCVSVLSFCLGALVIMAAMNHPTSSPSGQGVIVLCAIGFVVGIVITAIGGAIHIFA